MDFIDTVTNNQLSSSSFVTWVAVGVGIYVAVKLLKSSRTSHENLEFGSGGYIEQRETRPRIPAPDPNSLIPQGAYGQKLITMNVDPMIEVRRRSLERAIEKLQLM